MPDELLGQPGEGATPEPAPEPSGRPSGEPVAPPQVPPKYAGKTPDELTTILTEQEKLIGRQGQELGQLRGAVEHMWAERFGQPQPAERPQPERPQQTQPGQPDPQEFFERPFEMVSKVVDAKLSRAWEQLDRTRRAEVAERTVFAFQEGQQYMKQNPHLFAGIEGDVAQGIAQTLGPMAAQGQDVSRMLRDPKTWEIAALALRYDRKELDKFQPPPRKGMAPTEAELPSPTRQTQDDEGIILEDSDRKEFEEIHGRKGTDKEIREKVKLGLKTIRRR